MTNFRIYGLCAVAATALLMAGCGGGGSTRPAPTPSSSGGMPTDQQQEMTALEKAEQALTEAKDALEKLPEDATAAQKLKAEQDVLEAAEVVLAGLKADASTPHGDVADAQKEVDMAQIAVDATTEMIADAKALAARSTPLMVDGKKFQAAVKLVANYSRLKTVCQWTCKRKEGSWRMEARSPTPGMTKTATGIKAKAFAKSKTMDAPMVSADGWMGSVHTRMLKVGEATSTMGDDVITTETVTVYTDRMAPSGRTYASIPTAMATLPMSHSIPSIESVNDGWCSDSGRDGSMGWRCHPLSLHRTAPPLPTSPLRLRH